MALVGIPTFPVHKDMAFRLQSCDVTHFTCSSTSLLHLREVARTFKQTAAYELLYTALCAAPLSWAY